MNIKNMDLNLLKVFCALYERPHVSEAAKTLGLSQPAVSHALNRLRESFDDPLFVRSSKGMIPTARSLEIGPKIVKLFKELDDNFEKKIFDPSTDEGIFKIKGTDYFEQAILPQFVNSLRNDAPDVRLISQSTQGVLPVLELEKGLCDIAVAGFFGKLPNGFYQQKLFTDSLVGISRKGHPYLKNKNLKEFLKWPQMVISPEGKLEGLMDKNLALQKKSRTVITSVSSFMPSGWIVQDSDILLALPCRLALQLTQLLNLTMFELPIELPSIQVVQVWHESVHLDSRHQWMRKKLFDICQKKI